MGGAVPASCPRLARGFARRGSASTEPRCFFGGLRPPDLGDARGSERGDRAAKKGIPKSPSGTTSEGRRPGGCSVFCSFFLPAATGSSVQPLQPGGWWLRRGGLCRSASPPHPKAALSTVRICGDGLPGAAVNRCEHLVIKSPALIPGSRAKQLRGPASKCRSQLLKA